MSASPPGQRPGIDWGIGNYESTAAKLVPAARLVVDRAEPVLGATLVDVGCGTGNAALIAAERGAHVTGVDPAARLLEVARREAAERGLDVSFIPGDAASLPLPDGAARIVVSVFGVIFAADAEAAAAELARVTAPGGRIVLSAWIPEGAISRTTREFRQTIARALGTPPGLPPFAWHDRGALAELLDPLGFEVETEEASLSFGARSAREFLEDEMRDHPASVAGRAVLEPRGEMDALRERTLAILEEANEDPAAFRVTSRYVIARATRRG
jgi:ubiquinone/menaquinone biosynthesis C-methylase UbiE